MGENVEYARPTKTESAANFCLLDASAPVWDVSLTGCSSLVRLRSMPEQESIAPFDPPILRMTEALKLRAHFVYHIRVVTVRF